MKKLVWVAGLGLVSLLVTGFQAQACNPGCGGARPVPGAVRPGPGAVLPGNVQPQPIPPGGNQGKPGVGQNNGGDSFVWDLPAEEKARLRQAAQGKTQAATSRQVIRVNRVPRRR